MLVCFVPGPFASCVPGVSCSDALLGCVSGFVPSLVKNAGRIVGMPINASCVTSFVPGCDAIMTTQTQAYAMGLYPGTTYAVETSTIMFEPRDTLKPWEFLSPFSWVLWVSICVLAMVITPVVTALVENNPEITVADNSAMFLPDSVHAYAGVDTLKRTGDAFTADSALLSAVVALVTRVLVALYQCNLVAYVIFSYMAPKDSSTIGPFGSVATTPEFKNAWPSARVFDTQEAAMESYASGTSDAIVGSDAYLDLRSTCADHVAPLSGPKVFDVLAYSSKNGSTVFDDAFGKLVATNVRMVADAACIPEAKSITLNETLGIFVAFGACMACVSMMAVIVHVTRHENFCARRRNPESPDSLPESVHA